MSKSYSPIIREVLLSLRGSLSQEQVNRRLKAKSNQVARWESGHATIDWDSFCDLCQATRKPLNESLRQHLFFDGNLKDSSALINFYSGFSNRKKLAEKLKMSPSQISRIYSGQSPFTLELFLRLIDQSPYNYIDFLAALTAPNVPSIIQDEQKRIQQEKKVHFEKPWVAALLLYFRTKEYLNLRAHSDSFLAKKLGKAVEEVRATLDELERLQIIEIKNKHYISHVDHLSTGGSFEGAVNIRKYWLEKFLYWMGRSKPGKNNYIGYKVFNVHQDYLPKIEDFYFRIHKELDALIKEQPLMDSDKVMVFSFQLREVNDEID